MSDMGFRIPGSSPTEVVIPPGTTTADLVSLSSFVAAKYLISFFNTTEDVYKSMEAFVTKESSGNISDTVNSKLGDNLKLKVNFLISGSDLQLEVINSETFPLTLHFFRKLI